MSARRSCCDCGTEIAPSLLACPACGRLVHTLELEELANRARRAEGAGELTAALSAWREALELLPAGSRQASVIAERTAELSLRVGEDPDAGDEPERPAWLARGGALAAAGLLLWKLKVVVAFVVTKGKVLLLGLTKSGTVFSMLVSAGLYWTIWGWAFAFGLVAAIYVHEMGHVVALQRLGIRATAPMFIPGLGAVVRLKQYPTSAVEDARVGLAGPVWGLGAVVAIYVAHLATGWASLAAIARFAAWINLFNLLPIAPLDGGRGFRALSASGRWLVLAAFGAMWLATSDGLLVLLALVGLLRTLTSPAPERSDRTSLVQFLLLVAALSGLATIPVPGPGGELLP